MGCNKWSMKQFATHAVGGNPRSYFFIHSIKIGKDCQSKFSTFERMDDEYFMKQALQLARQAFDEGEVPVGAVVVIGDKIIARGYNQVEKLNDSTAHAEMIALTSAFNYLGAKYLPDARLYVTVEPCLMCAGAMYWSKISNVSWGANDEKNGHRKFTGSHSPFHPKTFALSGLCQDEAASLMKEFFRIRR